MSNDPKEPIDHLDDCVFDDDEPDDDLYLEEDCGKMEDGTCMYAGSEFCDWDCPHERASWKRPK